MQEEQEAAEEERKKQALRVRVRREDMPEEQEAAEEEEDKGGFWMSGRSRSVGKVRTAVPRLRRQRAGKWWMRRWYARGGRGAIVLSSCWHLCAGTVQRLWT